MFVSTTSGTTVFFLLRRDLVYVQTAECAVTGAGKLHQSRGRRRMRLREYCDGGAENEADVFSSRHEDKHGV